jgi:Fuc2NAc and GlcNAc transferase
MGDVGSGALGFMLAAVPLFAMRRLGADIWPWLILWGAFAVDATTTLLRRAINGRPLHEAHRTHAYQWLARRWNSHGKAVLAYAIVNWLWLAPWAFFAARNPGRGAIASCIALAPLVLLALGAGAGRQERS